MYSYVIWRLSGLRRSRKELGLLAPLLSVSLTRSRPRAARICGHHACLKAAPAGPGGQAAAGSRPGKSHCSRRKNMVVSNGNCFEDFVIQPEGRLADSSETDHPQVQRTYYVTFAPKADSMCIRIAAPSEQLFDNYIRKILLIC